MTTNKKEQKITVSFVQYEEYEPIPVYSKQVGQITKSQANEFLRILANTPCDAKCCTSHIMSAEYNIGITRGQDADRAHKQSNYMGSGNLEISCMFFDDSQLQCIKRNNRAKSEACKMHTCANAMREGKCVDPIMRNLAAMMYPEKYNEKQK